MNDVVNPIAPPQPTFEPPSADVEISAEAREFARAPVYVSPGVNREPSDAEQVARLVTARDVMGQSFWGPKSAPPPTAAEVRENDRLNTIGVQPGVNASSYALNLPAGVAPEAADMIKGGLAALEFSPVVGSYLAQRIADLGAKFHTMSDADKASWSGQQQRIVDEWATSKGWDLEAKKADVRKLLSDRKVPELVAGIIASDADMAIRLMMHVENLRSVKR